MWEYKSKDLGIFASENEDLKKRRIIKRENGSVY